jgi:hypothetical protein
MLTGLFSLLSSYSGPLLTLVFLWNSKLHSLQFARQVVIHSLWLQCINCSSYSVLPSAFHPESQTSFNSAFNNKYWWRIILLSCGRFSLRLKNIGNGYSTVWNHALGPLVTMHKMHEVQHCYTSGGDNKWVPWKAEVITKPQRNPEHVFRWGAADPAILKCWVCLPIDIWC